MEQIDIQSISDQNNQNVKATISHFPQETALINELIGLYTDFSSAIGGKVEDVKIVEYQLFWICLRAIFSSTELMFSAHIAESYALTRRAIESAGYALHIYLAPEKAKVWAQEDPNGQTFKDTFKPRFIGDQAKKIRGAYDITSAHGAHPNLSSTIFHQMKAEPGYMQNVYTDIGNIKNLHRTIIYLIFAFEAVLEIFEMAFIAQLSSEWKTRHADFNVHMKTRMSEVQNYFLDHSDLA